MTLAISSGTCGARARSGSGARVSTWAMSCTESSVADQGGAPPRSSYAVSAQEYWSARPSSRSLSICSGAMYRGVPIGGPVSVSVGKKRCGGGPRECRLRSSRDAEVEHLDDAVLAEHDVVRLHVAVDDAALVGEVERARDVDEPPQALREGDVRPLAHEGAEHRALDVLHGDEADRLGGPLRGHLADVVDDDDVRVLERRGGARLAEEAIDVARLALSRHSRRRRRPGRA